MKTLLKFTISDGTDMEEIESLIGSAIFNAECAFGKSRVRLEAAYYVPEDKSQCLIDVSSPIGEHVAQVFTGLLIHHVGEEQFRVERIIGSLEGKT